MTGPFTHLHCHSEYSLLDGAGTLDGLLSRAKELGMTSLALTDHGNLYGALKFYEMAKGMDIHPVLGYEAYVAPGDRRLHTGGMKGSNYHLTMLAMNMTGFNNLIKLASLAFLEGYYYKPRIDKELLKQYNEGIIVLSGCLGGEINQLLISPTGAAIEQAEEVANWYRDVFGDRYYFEIQNNDIPEQAIAMKHMVEMSKRMNIPLVATSDVHYIKQEDAPVQDILLCVNTKSLRSEQNRMRMETDQFFLRSPEQMYEKFPGFEDAVARSDEIAQRCNVDWKLGQRYFPVFTPPDGKTSQEYLWDLCIEGLKKNYANNPKRYKDGKLSQEVLDRLKREHDVINKLGFPNYFLIVWDYVHFAREKGIECTARGSGVGALTSYALGISRVCPLEYNLLFERFLDENRTEAPDIDVDFEQARRAEVIQYVKDRYGEDHVAQIGTYGTMAAKNAIKDVGRALGISLNEVSMCTSKIPDAPHTTIKKTLAESPDFKAIYDNDPTLHDLIDLAMRTEGLTRQCGTHACAVVIGGDAIDKFIPLMTVSGKEDYVTQWEGCDVEKAGLLKMDFLGLRNLSILTDSVRLIKQTTGKDLDVYNLPLDDKPSYDLLCRGESKGVFQLESGGMRDLLKRMKPDNIRDIIAILALYRPGPLEGGMVDTYIEVKHGRQAAEYLHPVMKEVLEETNGVMVYQEQVMQILYKLGEIPLGKAYKVIKAISKKKQAIIDANHEAFVEGAQKNGMTKENAESVWGLIIKFAGYGFNKSHTTAYAMIAYITAYLKCHYPVEFMAALLTGDLLNRQFNKKDPTVEHIEDCKRMGVEVVPPCVNTMGPTYRIQDGKIHFCACAIKNCNEEAGAEIRREVEENGPFVDLYDFCERIDQKKVSKAAVESLIKAGAFDCFHAPRAAMIAALDNAFASGARAAKDKAAGQMSIFGDLEEEDGVKTAQPLPKVEEWDIKEKCSYEKETLGFYMSAHPMDAYRSQISFMRTHTVPEALALPDKSTAVLCGMITALKISSVREPKPGRPSTFASFDLEDFDASIRCNAWPETYANLTEIIASDAIVACAGRIDKRDGSDNANFTITDVFKLEEIDERYVRSIELRLSEKVHGPTVVNDVSDILSGYPGEKPLIMRFYTADDQCVVFAPSARKFNVCDELRTALETRINSNDIKINIVRPNMPAKETRKRWQKAN